MGAETLGPRCAALLASVAGSGDALGDLVVRYPAARPALAVLSRELSEVQMVARLLDHNAADDSRLPAKLATALRNVVEGAGFLAEEINDALDSPDDDEARRRVWLEHTTERLAPLGRLVESARIAMNLGLDALLLLVECFFLLLSPLFPDLTNCQTVPSTSSPRRARRSCRRTTARRSSRRPSICECG